MSPSDAVVALTSFPRRWRAVLVRPDDDKEELVRRPGADGQSALDHLAAATARIRDAASAVARELGVAAPALAGAPSAESVDAALAALSEASYALVGVIEEATADDWKKGSALELLRGAVGEAAARLRQAEQVIHEVKGR
jgi:hypothetical protein